MIILYGSIGGGKTQSGPPLMMSDLATAEEMMEIDGLDATDKLETTTPGSDAGDWVLIILENVLHKCGLDYGEIYD